MSTIDVSVLCPKRAAREDAEWNGLCRGRRLQKVVLLSLVLATWGGLAVPLWALAKPFGGMLSAISTAHR